MATVSPKILIGCTAYLPSLNPTNLSMAFGLGVPVVDDAEEEHFRRCVLSFFRLFATSKN